MGDPKKQRRKYATPSHPWQKTRLDEEAIVVEEYSLKNKKEIWKMQSRLRHFTSQAKELAKAGTKQSDQRREQMLASLRKIGVLKENTTLDDVLELSLKDIMERRLQTLVLRKGLAKTMKQARQFIVHKHVVVNGRVMSVPSYIVPIAEEGSIAFVGSSTLSSPEHPERAAPTKPKKQRKPRVKKYERK